MVLQKLVIEMGRYGPNKGKYEGVACFDGESGDVALKLTPALCEKIFVVCAEGILTVAKEAAANLTCAVIEHQKAIGAD